MSSSMMKFSFVALFVVLYLTVQCESRYLPTRAHGDELDKLRELMLQILESSNEERPDTAAERLQQQIGSPLRSWGKQGASSLDLSDDKILSGSGRSKFGRYF
ncbi:uncharacterized protein LOC129951107 [Eupeodes corollae]|uniref:uncharacterized protein LOC129951107 n=1 Tax=Eupeodes corollae TaxID=290404 RepID=UPI0024912499|nr:uncharacterized protein LOC129951107 [Eupeodes corollae]